MMIKWAELVQLTVSSVLLGCQGHFYDQRKDFCLILKLSGILRYAYQYMSYGGLLIYCFVLPRYIIRNGGIDTEAGYPYPCNKSCCFDKDKVGATLTGKRQRSRIPRSVLALRSN